MIFSNRKISARQMQAAVALIIFSSSLIGMPQTAVYNIYSVLIGALITAAECALICFSVNKLACFDKSNRIVKILAGLSLIITAGANIRLVCSAVSLYLLPKTPVWIVAAVFAAGALYMASTGAQGAGRTGEIIFVIAAVNAVIAAAVCIYDTGGGMLTAAFEQSGDHVLLNGFRCSFMFGGAQSLFILLPETEGENRSKKAICAVMMALAAVVAFTYTAVSKFGLGDTADRVFPALNIMDTVNLEAFLGDRQDVLMLRMWFFAVFAAVGFEILLFGKGLVKDGGSALLICAGASVAFVLSLIFDGASSAVAGIYLTGGASLAVFAVVSVLSLIAWKWRKKG